MIPSAPSLSTIGSRAPAAAVDLTQDLRELAYLATADESFDELLRRGLDWLSHLAQYDLATVFMLQGNTLVVRAARGPLAKNPAVRGHTLQLDRFPTIREALETRRARAYTEDDHAHGDGDPFDGVLDLPLGHSCMVVPLFAADRCFGVLTLDRTHCEPYPQPVVNLAEIYGQMLSLAIGAAEQRATLERLRNQDSERARLLDDELAAGGDDIFEKSQSPLMRELARRARHVAETDTLVLILGETGTGKERLARTLHRWSRRYDRPFVKVNCAAIPANLVESELFGHVRGAFTGAARDRPGRFALANGGTLLLDEIGELPLDVQVKLLRVLQEGTLEPVGSDRTLRVDVRIFAATHVDLERAVAERTFREDLYYRLNVFPVRLPPLRERLEDIPHLCQAILSEQARRTWRHHMSVTPEGVRKLCGYSWPGNLRELSNVLERAMILSAELALGPESLDLPTVQAARAQSSTWLPTVSGKQERVLTLDEVQRAHIRQTLAFTGGRLYGAKGAAKLLGMKPSTLQSRMKKLGIAREALAK